MNEAEVIAAARRADADGRLGRSGTLRFSALTDFTAVEEQSAEPLLGTEDDTVLAVGGEMLTYGTAGAGKTTLAIDGIAHLAAGVPWLALDVPRPLMITVIENEGPRGKFRQKLARKIETWTGPPFASRIHVLEEPWASFTFGDERHRQELAEHLNATQSDLLLCGPISTLGMVGGGTPDEINTFAALIAQMRRLVTRPVAVWSVHHENRAGQVSGAWERVPDTLMHVTSRGNGHTRILWQKARWSSELHGTTLHLSWTEAAGYTVDEPKEPATTERIWDDIATFVLANGGCSWNLVERVKDEVSGNADLKRKTRDRMLADGVLVNVGTKKGFELWHRDDPARPQDLIDEVRPSMDAPEDAPASAQRMEGAGEVRPCVLPLRKDAGHGRTFPTSAVEDEPADELEALVRRLYP